MDGACIHWPLLILKRSVHCPRTGSSWRSQRFFLGQLIIYSYHYFGVNLLLTGSIIRAKKYTKVSSLTLIKQLWRIKLYSTGKFKSFQCFLFGAIASCRIFSKSRANEHLAIINFQAFQKKNSSNINLQTY